MTKLTDAWGQIPYLLAKIHQASLGGPRKGRTWRTPQHSKQQILRVGTSFFIEKEKRKQGAN